ncbi:MAG: DHH family phosphoesterase [Oscillospiraceae bacterium]|nr:DHH family phosphoesterase [Oscillospiraceae bacterium]
MNRKLGRLLEPGLEVFFGAMLVFAFASLVAGAGWLALVELVATGVLFANYYFGKLRRRRELEAFIQSATNTLGTTDGGRTPFPMALVRMGDGDMIWANNAFMDLSGFREKMHKQNITDLLPGFNMEWILSGKREYPSDVTVNGHRYRIYGSAIRADDPSGTMLAALYFTDLTDLYQIRDEYVRSRPVVSIILIDNYEELTKNLTESATSNLNASLNEAITAWAEDYHGLLRRMERNRYLLIFEKRDLQDAINNKFSILEQMHSVTNPSGVAASISFGLGVDGSTFEESYEFAALAVEMSLSRGGDQAVIKDRLNFNFYGGRSKEVDQRSKVRSRVTANSLMELIAKSGDVYIMGHKNADMDAVGAALGVVCLCRKQGKKAYIVLDLENNASERLIEEIRAVPEYEDVIVSGQDALLRCDRNSILIVVDTNRPDQVECRPLLEAISKVSVIDHHRRAADYISPVVVNFHEPYASSASELVTELLQYAVEKADVLPIESKGLLAGIFLDTKSFNVRSGERTFEAAAFLRRLGADTIEVKKLLQSDFQNTVARYRIIQSATVYRDEIAIVALDHGVSRPMAAQAADELLNITGFQASFVLYPDDQHRVVISARSIGEANVQVILEALGGGGNAATAGAQLKDSTVAEALERLKESIDNYYDN